MLTSSWDKTVRISKARIPADRARQSLPAVPDRRRVRLSCRRSQTNPGSAEEPIRHSTWPTPPPPRPIALSHLSLNSCLAKWQPPACLHQALLPSASLVTALIFLHRLATCPPALHLALHPRASSSLTAVPPPPTPSLCACPRRSPTAPPLLPSGSACRAGRRCCRTNARSRSGRARGTPSRSGWCMEVRRRGGEVGEQGCGYIR